MAASACSVPSAAAGSVELLCTVEGTKLLSSGMTEAAICGDITREIDRALSQQTRTVKSVASIGNEDWIRIAVRFAQPGTASAAVTQRIGEREFVHPEIAVDVMDKPMGPKEVSRLAEEIARAIVNAAKT